MEIILYLSVALIAIAFTILVVYASKTLKAMQLTMVNVAHTVDGLNKQMEGLTKETTELLGKTNKLADDLQQKSNSLNGVFDSVKELGTSIGGLNNSIKGISTTVSKTAEKQSDNIANAVQWGNVFIDLYTKWKIRKQNVEVNKE